MRATAPPPTRSRRGPLISLAIALLVMGLVVVAVRWAVDNTLTRHAEVEPGSSLLVTIHGERQSSAEHDEAELVEAVVAICQLEVGGKVDPDSLRLVDDDADLYQVEFTPSLDTSDRRQLKGCIQDVRIDHFKASIVSMEDRAG